MRQSWLDLVSEYFLFPLVNLTHNEVELYSTHTSLMDVIGLALRDFSGCLPIEEGSNFHS